MLMITERLILRAYHQHEADRLAQLANEWDIAKWMVALPYPYHREDAVRCIAQVHKQHIDGNPLSFAFALKETDELIGGGGLDGEFDCSDNVAIGYWLGLEYQGKGYGTEVLGALIRYGFDALKVGEIYASANPINYRSQRALEKAGFISIPDVPCEPTREGGFTHTKAYVVRRTKKD